MPATQYKQQPLGSKKIEPPSTWLRRVLGISAAATLLELGATLAGAEANAEKSEPCSRCNARRNSRSSYAQYPNAFCAKECEQEFIRGALASLTLEDCIRIQHRLDALLMGAQEMALQSENVEQMVS